MHNGGLTQKKKKIFLWENNKLQPQKEN